MNHEPIVFEVYSRLSTASALVAARAVAAAAADAAAAALGPAARASLETATVAGAKRSRAAVQRPRRPVCLA